MIIFYTTDEAAFCLFQIAQASTPCCKTTIACATTARSRVMPPRHGIGYINVEARHGHAAEQREMLQALLGLSQ